MKIWLGVLIALTLSSCRFVGLDGEDGPFRDRTGEYQEAPVIPQIEVPDDLDSYTLDALYVIPQQLINPGDVFDEIPLPRAIATRRQEGVVIQALNGRRWIVIDATPGQVWPLVRDYWTSLQIELDYENPGAGIVETAWLAIGNNSELRHKYRLSIEPGLHSGYSEVYITHLQQNQDDPVPIVLNWPDTSSDQDMENQVMTSVSQYLADRNDVYQASSSSLLAGSIEAESKANLIETEAGDTVLELKVAYERAWVIVRGALEDAQAEILESDRDQSFYNVRFAGIVEEEDEPGFFGRLMGRGNRTEEREPRDYLIKLVDEEGAIVVVAEEISAVNVDENLRLELLQAIDSNLG